MQVCFQFPFGPDLNQQTFEDFRSLIKYLYTLFPNKPKTHCPSDEIQLCCFVVMQIEDLVAKGCLLMPFMCSQHFSVTRLRRVWDVISRDAFKVLSGEAGYRALCQWPSKVLGGLARLTSWRSHADVTHQVGHVARTESFINVSIKGVVEDCCAQCRFWRIG